MAERDQQQRQRPDDLTGKGHGPEGNDKVPGEETSQDMENVVAETQKGRNKNDGDPSRESDKPVGPK